MKRNGNFLNTNAQRYALIGASFGLLFPTLAILIRTTFAGIPLSFSSILAAHALDTLLWIVDTAPLFLGIFAAIAGRRQDQVEQINSKLKARERELETAQHVLEERVNDRTRELTSKNQLFMERAQLLNAVVETSRSLLVTPGLDQLLPTIVQAIGHHFNYYHVGLYLLDEQKRHAVLIATNREDGQRMIQHGQGLVEFAIRSGQAKIVKDSESDTKLLPGPEQAAPRAELVLPLTSGQLVIGAIDLQADHEVEFTEEYVSILQILADLVAIAIQNSTLYDQTQRTLHEVEVGSRQISAKEWSDWLESFQTRGYRYDGIRAEPLRKGSETNSSTQKKSQSIAIRLRDRTIGSLQVKLSEGFSDLTEDDRAIAEAAAERAALALEGARLLDEAKRRAAREAFLSDMAAKLGASFRLDSILRDTVEELGHALENSTVSFQLIDPSTSRDVRPWTETPMKPRDKE
jgi:GAF domain-containing protein